MLKLTTEQSKTLIIRYALKDDVGTVLEFDACSEENTPIQLAISTDKPNSQYVVNFGSIAELEEIVMDFKKRLNKFVNL